MGKTGNIKRYENKARLIRDISEETGTPIEELWEEYEKQTH